MDKRIVVGIALGICVFVSGAYSAETNKVGNLIKPVPAIKLIGSSKADLYHMTECPQVKNISSADQVPFNAPEEAIKAGYKPCPECKPPLKSAQFIGEKGTKRYHIKSCKMMRHIVMTDMALFKSDTEAKSAGYQPCPVCIPQEKDVPASASPVEQKKK